MEPTQQPPMDPMAPKQSAAPQSPTPVMMEKPGGTGNAGAIIAIVVIVVAIIVGALYVWSQKEGAISEEQLSQMSEQNQQQVENDVQSLQKTSGSNQIADIDIDLQSTNTASIDAALESLDLELQ